MNVNNLKKELMTENNNNNDYKSFCLFNDIEDITLRNRNRAVVMANLLEDNLNKEKKINPKGAALLLGYFNRIPEGERADVHNRFTEGLLQRGFILVN